LRNLISQAEAQGIQIDVLDRETDWGRLEYEPLAQWIQSGIKQ
jgi:hypothetical protein